MPVDALGLNGAPKVFSYGCNFFLTCTATKAGCPTCPDFMRRPVALIHSMRLSIMKGAHADLSSSAWQEIGVKPYFGLGGIPLGRIGTQR
jgi:hypothetical protein